MHSLESGGEGGGEREKEGQSCSNSQCFEIVSWKQNLKMTDFGGLNLSLPSKIADDNTFIFLYFYLLKKIRFDVSCESSA